MDISNKKLKAAHSHFVSRRDRIVADLDSLLNAHSGQSCMDAIIENFEKLAIVNIALDNIGSIVSDNAGFQNAPEGLDFSQLEEMNRLADAIKQKVEESRSKEESNQQN